MSARQGVAMVECVCPRCYQPVTPVGHTPETGDCGAGARIEVDMLGMKFDLLDEAINARWLDVTDH